MAEPISPNTVTPGFSLPSHLGDTVDLESLRGATGKNVVVFFYPLDWTPV